MDIHRPELKKQRLHRQGLLGGLGLLMISAAGVALYLLGPAKPEVERSSVWVDKVQFGDFVREVRGPGTLVPREIRWVSTASAGRVERVLAKPGVRVATDTVLIELSNPELQQQAEEAAWAAEAAKAELQSLRAELERQLLDVRSAYAALKYDYESARLQVEAEQDLAERGIISRLQYEKNELLAKQLRQRSELELNRIEQLESSIKSQLVAQQAKVEQVQHLANRRQQQLDGLSVRADIEGVLQRVDVEPGQRVKLGDNVARVAQPEQLIAELRIAETQARDIQLEQPVQIDTRNGIVPGHVMRIDPAVQNGTVQVDVELIGELPPGVRPDLSVDGTIEIERLQDVLYIGRPVFGQPESKVTLFRIGSEDIAQRVEVELGRASVNQIEIRSGLQQGDRVILSDVSQWNDFDRLQLQ